MRRSSRHVRRPDYARLNKIGMESQHSSASEEDRDVGDEDLDYVEDMASEEGEIPDEEEQVPSENISLDTQISEALEKDDFETADKLLNEKERRCHSLKVELKKEKEKEQEERKQRIRDQMIQRFQQLKRTEDGLIKSLQDSRVSWGNE